MISKKYVLGLLALCLIQLCCADVFDDFASALKTIASSKIKLKSKAEQELINKFESKDFVDLLQDFNETKMKTFYDTHLKNLINDGIDNKTIDINFIFPEITFSLEVKDIPARIQMTMSDASLLTLALYNEDFDTVKKLLKHGANYQNVVTERQQLAALENVLEVVLMYTDLAEIMHKAPADVIQVLNNLKVDLSVPTETTWSALPFPPLAILLNRYSEIRVEDENANTQDARTSKQMRDIILKAIENMDKKNINEPIILTTDAAEITTSFLSFATTKDSYCGPEIIEALLNKGSDPRLMQSITNRKESLESRTMPLYNTWDRFNTTNDKEDKNILFSMLKKYPVAASEIVEILIDIDKDGKSHTKNSTNVRNLLGKTADQEVKKELENLIQK